MMQNTVQILMTMNFDETLVQEISTISRNLQVHVFPTRNASDIPPEVWTETEILYTNFAVPKPENAPNLRWIQFHYAGIDHVLGEPILKKPDVVVTTMSGAQVTQISEFLLTFILSLSHKVKAMMMDQFRSKWPPDRWEKFSPKELTGSTVGLVGYGSTARELARLLQPFNVTLLGTKRNAMDPEDIGYTLEEHGDRNGHYLTRLYPPQALCSMLKECDFVVVTLPLTPETKGMIGTRELSVVKPGAFIIDISRGGILDHGALITALDQGQIAGAALDVFPVEPLPKESPLWSHPKVIITPHMAGNSPHYDRRCTDLFTENIQRYLNKQPLFNLYNPEFHY